MGLKEDINIRLKFIESMIDINGKAITAMAMAIQALLHALKELDTRKEEKDH
jgi:hypothetical protein